MQCLAVRSCFYGGRYTEAGRFPQSIRTIGVFPREARAAESEMPIRGGVLVNGAPKLKRFVLAEVTKLPASEE